MIVGMNLVLGPELAAGQFDRTVGDDLVGVHVGLRAAPCLPYHERKVLVEQTVDDLLRDTGYQFTCLLFESTEACVAAGGGQLENSERPNELARHAFVSDSEIGERSGGLRPPITIRRHLDLAMNLETRERFRRRSAILEDVRRFLIDEEVLRGAGVTARAPAAGGCHSCPS